MSIHFQSKPFNITVIWVYAPTITLKKLKFNDYEDLQDLLELRPEKDVLFIKGDWNAKVGSQEIPGEKKKKRDTWSNGQVWLWSRKWNRAKTNRVLPRELTVHSKHPLPTKHKRWLYTWTSPDGQYQNQIDCILCSWRWRSSIQSAKIRPGADCGSDHQLLIAKFKLKLKKVGKTTRPLRYDLNQIPYNYTVRWCIRLYRGDE